LIFHILIEYNKNMNKILIAFFLVTLGLSQISTNQVPFVLTDPSVGTTNTGANTAITSSITYRPILKPYSVYCGLSEVWDSTTGTCVPRCIQNVFCTINRIWSPIYCTCVCANFLVCPPGSIWDRNACACQVRINSDTSSWK
jgi:hypothetical protein